jgi:DNA-binding MarR family transcriptional regulator
MRMAMEQRLGHHIKRVEQELIAVKHSVLRPFNLNVPQYTALLALDAEPGLSGAVLARRCLVTPQTMSSVLATLERRGLVERKPHPIHGHILETRLTRSGRSLLNRADAAAVDVELHLGGAFSAAETAQLIALLGRCSEALAALAPARVKTARR